MWRASAVSHQIISSENPNPVANANTTTSASGAPSANTPSWTGHASTSSRPASSGRRGRQRIAEQRADHGADAGHASSTPNTPALP